MKLSQEWLSDFVAVTVSPREFAAKMTMSGSKVESVTLLGGDIQNVVVGKLLSVTRHPSADRLQICVTDVGGETPLNIVTGATNVAEGQYVPVALDGATLPGGKVIHAGELRGVMSQGMLCSFAELGLTQGDEPDGDPDGIYILDEGEYPLGVDIREVLGLSDVVTEYEITSNRPDCLSVRGLAREVSATFELSLTLSEPKVQGGGDPIERYLSINVEDEELCPRYTARMVQDVKIGPSPRWMRRRLRASGIRPISNIVDITNYVMLEYGQPMHAFDYACLGDKSIVVRRARDGESLETLDGQQRALTPDMLVIADSEKAVGVAGVMGGANSEITDKTRAIVFESANFNGASVRRTANALGMRTDASSRFEKGLDPATTIPAVQRACELVEQLGAGTVLGGILDVSFTEQETRMVEFAPDKINALLGTDIPAETMVHMLENLGFTVNENLVVVPGHRRDVGRWADLAEEVARLYGYDNIAATLPPSGDEGVLTPYQAFTRRIGALCRDLGFYEIVTYSFISPSSCDLLRWPADDPRRNMLAIQNPLGEDTSVMRVSGLPTMLDNLARNFKQRNPVCALYDLATVYLPRAKEKLPEEKQILTLGCYGDVDFFAFKGLVETLLEGLQLPTARFEAEPHNPSYHPGRCARLYIDGACLGIIGEPHPEILKSVGLESRAYLAELDVNMMIAHTVTERHFRALPRFPAVTRDIALVCDAALPAGEVEETIVRAGGNLLCGCRLFDVYTGQPLPEGKKSLAFALTLRADDRTLTDAEAEQVLSAVLAAAETEHGCTLRG